MRKHHQVQFSAPAPVAFSFAVRSLPSFDHRHDGFDLGSLSILLFVKSGLHQSAVPSLSRFLGWPSMLGRNDRSERHLLSGEFVIGFAVVTGISENRSEFDSSCCLANQPFELAYIGIRASASSKGNDEVVGNIDNNSKLRITPVCNGFPRALLGRSAFDKVGTSRRCVETR